MKECEWSWNKSVEQMERDLVVMLWSYVLPGAQIVWSFKSFKKREFAVQYRVLIADMEAAPCGYAGTTFAESGTHE
jgi:hypothetical protein